MDHFEGGKPLVPLERFQEDRSSAEFVGSLEKAGVRTSMDGRGRWMDDIMFERLWRSLKYENVYLNAYETGTEARKGLRAWIDFYNARHPHSSRDNLTPYEIYCGQPGPPRRQDRNTEAA
jgi:putative transposase